MTARLADGVVDHALEEDDPVLEEQVAQGHLPLPRVVAVALELRLRERMSRKTWDGPSGTSPSGDGRRGSRRSVARGLGRMTFINDRAAGAGRQGVPRKPHARRGGSAGPPGGVREPALTRLRIAGPPAGVAVWSSGLDGRLGLVERHVLDARRTRGYGRGPCARGSASPGRRPALPSRPAPGPAATLSSVRAAIASISSSRSSSSTLISSASAILARMKNSLSDRSVVSWALARISASRARISLSDEAFLPQLHDQPAGSCSSPAGRPGRRAGRTASGAIRASRIWRRIACRCWVSSRRSRASRSAVAQLVQAVEADRARGTPG